MVGRAPSWVLPNPELAKANKHLSVDNKNSVSGNHIDTRNVAKKGQVRHILPLITI